MPGFRALFLQLNSCHGHFIFSVALGCSYPFLFMLFHLKSFVLVQYMACNNLIIFHKGHQLLIQYMACNNLIIGPVVGCWVAQQVFVELFCLVVCCTAPSRLLNWQLSCLVLVCLKYIIMKLLAGNSLWQLQVAMLERNDTYIYILKLCSNIIRNKTYIVNVL
jgi:hypothetical protein